MNREDRLAADNVVGEPILFYHPWDEFGVFSNFSLHAIWMPDPFTGIIERYQTTEHYYQAMKAVTSAEHAWVRDANGPGQSKFRGGPKGIKLREDWGDSYGDVCYLVMVDALTAKATTHDEMRAALKRSGDRHLYEDSPTDDIWGWRYEQDYSGKNLLGRALMEVRKLIA